MPVAVFPLGALETNSYLMYDKNEAVAVDVGGEPDEMLDWLAGHKVRLAAICATHLHFDHLYGVAALTNATGAPVYTPPGDDALSGTEAGMGGIWGFPPVPFFESKAMPLGKHAFAGMDCEVLETPGHTPGGVSLYFPAQQIVFTGDALFYRSIGHTVFPLGNHATLLRSIHEKLFALPENTKVFPGHGPSTTIGDEIKNNPFCGKFVQ
ncbi:MAG: MBL fold metallo-hydrolase [Desulfovibrio sp.]|jgi:glyoxylase-like metal-dependent hydrolase (beta-lactamase superfamily II)|nr:MBL fold metallo-hydrolase [Desulfovibrio sp.]